MGRDKKWSSNDKNQLLVENFRKFMEEGDFSPEPEVNEGEEDDNTDIRLAARKMLKNIHAVKDQIPEQARDAVTKIYAAPFLVDGAEYSIPLSKLTEDWILGVMGKIPEENLMVSSGRIKTDDEGNQIQRKDWDPDAEYPDYGNQYERTPDVFSESGYFFDEKRNRTNFPIVHVGSRVTPCPESEIGYINPRGEVTLDLPGDCYQGAKKYK
ncbi:MAG: hypothetical protein H8E74_07385 [Gammaproteobacteria bacterium]|nr:hypothetical protein [Gammaproteobacteria bacterium]